MCQSVVNQSFVLEKRALRRERARTDVTAVDSALNDAYFSATHAPKAACINFTGRISTAVQEEQHKDGFREVFIADRTG
jgi:hypothetical protein